MMITAVPTLEEILAETQKSDEPLVWYGVSWDDYLHLLDLTEGRKYPQFTYYNGVLKIIGKQSFTHENLFRFLYDWVRTTGRVFQIKMIPAGSMTLVSKSRSKGAEPDESFYIQNADKVPNKKTLFDDKKDTPPDLVIEVDESSKSEEKFAIYADFGVREFWRFNENTLRIYELDEFSAYREVGKSVAFPVLSVELLNEFLEKGVKENQFDALTEFENDWKN